MAGPSGPAFPFNFYPRSPCGERLGQLQCIPGRKHFYPRSPCGERPPLTSGTETIATISIHALLAESDAVTTLEGGSLRDFYPRSPCGERRLELFLYYQDNGFLSTLSLRRATSERPGTRQPCAISIHALLAESDNLCISIIQLIEYFYPRSPCGERQCRL